MSLTTHRNEMTCAPTNQTAFMACRTGHRHSTNDELPQEPEPEEIGRWEDVLGKRTLNKLIFMAEPARIDSVRPLVHERVGHVASLTQAQSNMLEVLPPGSSKGEGVRYLLDRLGVAPENVLAIGDAENVRRAHFFSFSFLRLLIALSSWCRTVHSWRLCRSFCMFSVSDPSMYSIYGA